RSNKWLTDLLNRTVFQNILFFSYTTSFNDSDILLNRTKRESIIEQRSCSKFQLELILIPLSIAMIPLGLSALLLCVCCCGPKESRGKVPEMFRKKAEIDAKDAYEIDDYEFTCKDGIVMRKDSKKTRFSTSISFIELNSVNYDMSNHDMHDNNTNTDSSNNGDNSVINKHSECHHLPQQTNSKRTRFSDNVDILGES
ncbi:unnamed protein product, partial [Thelazia callipaeda]|uniref:Sushi domain-containing protein n=1 Tax=Thelazia callipaeda TaxID=103827 RepID=A0A0N5D3N8_THECL